MKRLAIALTLVLIGVVTAESAAALCMSPMEVASAAPEVAANHRYAWFLVESLAHARLAWQEADDAADSHSQRHRGGIRRVDRRALGGCRHGRPPEAS